MLDLCKQYNKYICDDLGFEPEFFFPGRNPNKPLRHTSISAVFRKYWYMTDYAASCNNPPTPHDLRFTFITHRINQWALEGRDIDVMMPYLSRYVGHSSLQETYYYYHVSGELFEVIRSKDTTSAVVIPEVRYE
jgi:integrase